jgi:hypothetical protein
VTEHPISPKVMTGHIFWDIVLISSSPEDTYPNINRVTTIAKPSVFTYFMITSSHD